MNTNLENIAEIVDYVEENLYETLNLETLSKTVNYSKYHLHRIFTSVTGFTPHTYVTKRRLTEAARLLANTETPIIDIALIAGYDTQQSFSYAFKKYFKISPEKYRKKKIFYPLQLKFKADGNKNLRGDIIKNIETINIENITLVGYTGNTSNGFHVIGKSIHKLLKNVNKIPYTLDKDCIFGINDYSESFDYESSNPAFNFYAAVEVDKKIDVPKDMVIKELLPSKYIIFTLNGNPEDSLQPVADYIYKEWFPQSTCVFNENNMYDFTKTYTDAKRRSIIEYFVPIK